MIIFLKTLNPLKTNEIQLKLFRQDVMVGSQDDFLDWLSALLVLQRGSQFLILPPHFGHGIEGSAVIVPEQNTLKDANQRED